MMPAPKTHRSCTHCTPPDPLNDMRLLSIRNAAARGRVSSTTVRRALQDDRLTGKRIDSHRFVVQDEKFDRWLGDARREELSGALSRRKESSTA